MQAGTLPSPGQGPLPVIWAQDRGPWGVSWALAPDCRGMEAQGILRGSCFPQGHPNFHTFWTLRPGRCTPQKSTANRGFTASFNQDECQAQRGALPHVGSPVGRTPAPLPMYRNSPAWGSRASDLGRPSVNPHVPRVCPGHPHTPPQPPPPLAPGRAAAATSSNGLSDFASDTIPLTLSA